MSDFVIMPPQWKLKRRSMEAVMKYMPQVSYNGNNYLLPADTTVLKTIGFVNYFGLSGVSLKNAMGDSLNNADIDSLIDTLTPSQLYPSLFYKDIEGNYIFCLVRGGDVVSFFSLQISSNNVDARTLSSNIPAYGDWGVLGLASPEDYWICKDLLVTNRPYSFNQFQSYINSKKSLSVLNYYKISFEKHSLYLGTYNPTDNTVTLPNYYSDSNCSKIVSDFNEFAKIAPLLPSGVVDVSVIDYTDYSLVGRSLFQKSITPSAPIFLYLEKTN